MAYKNYVSSNLLNNTKVTVDDINRAVSIHGEPEPILEGKMTRPNAVILKSKVRRKPLPLPIKLNYQDIHLYVDFFFVNKLPFLLTKSGKLDFLTVEHMTSRTKRSIIQSLMNTNEIYKNRGLKISYLHGDGEFDMDDLRQDLAPIDVIIYGKNEHVHEIEREIRTAKERIRTATRAAPYERYTKLMTEHLVISRIRWLNKFPRRGSACQTMGPSSLILGQGKPDMSIKRIPFGLTQWRISKLLMI